MSRMIFAELHDLALAAPQAAALAIYAQAAVACAVGLGQIGVLLYGIAKMSEADKAWAATHREFMKAEARRHRQAMKAGAKRHERAMRDLRRLVRKTAPRGW